MGHPHRFIQLTDKQDMELLTLEKSHLVNSKIRLRASIIRLSNARWSVDKLSQHFQRSRQAIRQDLVRFEQQGIVGLTSGKSTGKPTKFTPEIIAFLKTQLELDRVWNSSLLSEAIEEKFNVNIARETIRVKLLELGYAWKRTRYIPSKKPNEKIVSEFKADLDTLKKGASEGKLTLKYLDQCGFLLMMTLCYTWFKKGSGKQFEVPTRWGSQGKINLIGTYSIENNQTKLEYRELAKNCNQNEVVSYLDKLAAKCDPNKITVIILDNATFHRGKEIKARKEGWEARGLFLRYLPGYSPFLNLIEGIWRKVKGFLMPRRCYNSVEELREALRIALKAMGGVEL